MLSILLCALFAAAAVLAVITIGSTWGRHGRSALAVRGELASCAAYRDFDLRITEVTVRASATVLRPDFSTGRRRASRALTAAA